MLTSLENRGYRESWLTFWLISVGTGGPSGRGPSVSGGSIGPFWDRFVEVVDGT